MSDPTPKRAPLQTRFYYGWLMVAVGGMGIFFSGPGQTYSNSVFIESYIAEFSLSQTTVASIYSAATLASGLLLFVIGRLTDRFGRRYMMTAAALFLGFSCLFNSMIMGPVTLFFGFFLIRYFGQGSMSLIPNTLVAQWFYRYRGRALSFAGLGGLLGAAAFPPLSNALIDAYGWRTTWVVIGAAVLLLLAPIAFIFVRNRPEDLGLLPDGANAAVPHASGSSAADSTEREHSWTLAEAMRTRAFWLVAVCAAMQGAVYTGFTFQMFSLLALQGIDRTTTSFLLSLSPLVSFGCSLLTGFLVERAPAYRILSLSMVGSVAAPLIFIFASSFPVALAGAVVWGVTMGVMSTAIGVIWPNYFGRQHLGSIQSVTHASLVIGSALGPIPFGWAFDQFGSYTAALTASAAVFAFGALLALLAAPPTRAA